jgi:hypothetical protein
VHSAQVFPHLSLLYANLSSDLRFSTQLQSSFFSLTLRQYSIMPLSHPGSEPRTLIPDLTFHDDSCATESPSPSPIPGSQERLPQPEYQMIARVPDELKNATHRADLTAEGAILHTDPNTVKAVIDCLESHHKLTHETLKLPPGTANPRSKSSATNPRFPSDGFKDEDDSYEPLVHLLNKVIDAANQCMSASYLSGL